MSLRNFKSVAASFWSICLSLSLAIPTTATVLQPSRSNGMTWKEHFKLAEQYEKEKKLHPAAEQYELAWRKRSDRTDFLVKAADLYYQTRDYRKAIDTYQFFKDNSRTYPQARLNYAMALKQCGKYDDATAEFLLYLNHFEGKDRDRATIVELVGEQLNGCALGIRLSEVEDKRVQIEHLNCNMTGANNVSPIPFSDDIVYFSMRSSSNKTALMRTQQHEGEWLPADTVRSLPIAPNVQFGNGTFAPDFSRFYYTQVETDPKGRQWSRLYCLKREQNTWSKPIRLRDYINTEGVNATHPCVVHAGGKREILYFASDRKGGKGGMDIWYAVRDMRHDDIDFELPKNAGTIINTTGDEVTPHYDAENGYLYFSSNGRTTVGGLDIFRAKGQEVRWITPENLGFPYNSGADDWYFVKNKSGSSGFLVSNRLFGSSKLTSTEDEIFAFNIKKNVQIALEGEVLDSQKKPIKDARVALYEMRGQDDLRLLTDLKTKDGAFRFPIFPDKLYHVEAEKEGYRLTYTRLSTRDSNNIIKKNFYLDRYRTLQDAIADAQGQYQSSKTTANENANKATQNNGLIYKIQVNTQTDPNDAVFVHKLKRLEELGAFDFEKIDGKNLTRVMLTNFNTPDEAKKVLAEVKKRGFKDAFIVKYKDGKRF